jgi:hypothetical protein
MAVIWIDSGRFGGVEKDPYFSNVSLLLHGNGTNSSTSIIDSSPNKLSLTSIFSAVNSTSQSRFGGSSLFFPGNGSGARIFTSASSSFAYGLDPFTVEGWLYRTTTNNQAGIFFSQSQSGVNYFILGLTADNRPFFISTPSGGGTPIVSPALNVSLNDWAFVAIVRENALTNGLKIYAQGDLVVSGTCNQNLIDTTRNPTIGGYTHTNIEPFIGYLDEFRVTKGIARYEVGTGANAGKMVHAGTNILALPTAPFPDS